MFRAVVFDFEGTLTAPGAIDFVGVAQAVQCPEGTPVLEHVQALPDAGRRQAALALLHRFEMAAAARSRPFPRAEWFVRRLQQRGVGCAVVTRNSRAAVARALKNFSQLHARMFGAIISRDDPHPAKPHPGGVRAALDALDVDPAEALLVGDYVFDLQAGRAAGTRTAYLQHCQASGRGRDLADFVVRGFDQLWQQVGHCLPPLMEPAQD